MNRMVVYGCVGILVIVGLTACGWRNRGGGTTSRAATYVVDGAASTPVQVTYTQQGVTYTEQVRLPWSKNVASERGDVLLVSAAPVGASTTLRCGIRFRGASEFGARDEGSRVTCRIQLP